MNDISVGAVGAAIIAGLVSLLGLIIGKEQKVSEFRQAWIDDLRKCLIAYLVNINAISDALRLSNAGTKIDNAALMANYKLLNEANHGIALRVNEKEKPSKDLLKSMGDFEKIASENSSLTPDQIRNIEKNYIAASKELLKFEWNRVKRGEKIFVQTKWAVALSIALMFALLTYLWVTRGKHEDNGPTSTGVQMIQSVSTEMHCRHDRADTIPDRRQPVWRKARHQTHSPPLPNPEPAC